MKKYIPVKMLVLALSITNIFCFGQQDRTAICRLGEITNDSILPYVRSLQIDCGSNDLKVFPEKSDKITALKSIILKGDTSDKEWEKLFKVIRSATTVKEIIFTENTFEHLPAGYNYLSSIESISFLDNENIDHAELMSQLLSFPNLKELTLSIVTIFDLPDNLKELRSLQNIILINTDETISQNENSEFSTPKTPVTYDYYIDKGDEKYASLKYIALAGKIDSDEYKELSKRFQTTTNFTSVSAFTPKYVNVIPPIKGIDVERSNYTINPTIENIITYPSGTKILIPANAFVDKNGLPVTSSITLSYREFRDPVDFLVSGIPMKYDTAGEITNFESAGMFELTAVAKNQPLQLAPGKKVDMNFVSTSKDSTYNFYAFNDKTGNWEYLNKPKTVTAETKIKYKPFTRSFLDYEYTSKNTAYLYDSANFQQRFEGSKYAYTAFKDSTNKRSIDFRKDRKTIHRSMNSLVRINNVKKTKEGDILFKVSYYDYAHPELREFNNVYFALNENMTAAEFRQKYARNKRYNDIRIKPSGGDVEIIFKDNKSKKDVSATIVTLNKKGKIKKSKDANTKLKRYNRRLNKREQAFNKKLMKGSLEANQTKITDPQELSIYAFNKVRKIMSEEEKKMTYEEWISYCKTMEEQRKQIQLDRMNTLAGSEANGENLIQSLSLDGLGIYNCDQIQRIKQPVEVFAKYKTADDKKLKPTSTYVIDKATNSVFQYDGYRGYDPGRIAFSKSAKAENTLLAINEDGSISVYRTEEFKKNDFRNKSRFEFNMTKIDPKFTSVADLKTLIGF